LFDVDISPSGQLLATAARGGLIRIWDLATRKQQAEFRLSPDHDAQNTDSLLRYVFVEFSPDGTTLAACSSGTREAVLWSVEAKSETKRLTGGSFIGLRDVGFTADGKHVLAGEGDANDRSSMESDSGHGKLWVWNVQTGQARSIPQHQDSIWSAASSPDGTRIATAGIDGSVRVLDLVTDQTQVLQAPNLKGMQRVQFSPDGRWVSAVPRLWGTATVWDVASGDMVKHIVFDSETIDARFSPDGKSMLVPELTGALHLFNAATWEKLTTYYHDGHQQNMAAFSPKGDLIVSVGDNGKIFGWKASPDEQKDRLGFSWPVSEVKFSADGQILAVGVGDGAVHIFDASTIETRATLPATHNPARSPGRFEFAFFSLSPDGRRVARLTASDASAVVVWDITDEEMAFAIKHDKTVMTVTYSPNGKLLATGTSVGDESPAEIRFWDAGTGQQVGPIIAQPAPIALLAFSPDSQSVATSLNEKVLATGAPSYALGKNAVVIRDVATGREVKTLKEHATAVGDLKAIAFSSNGSLFATAGYDRQVIVWDTRTWQPTARLLGHVTQLTDLSFSRDGTRLASAASDGWTRLWDLSTQREVARFRGSTVEFSPDGTTLAVGSSGGGTMHRDPVFEADGSMRGFKPGSEFLSLRLHRAPHVSAGRTRHSSFPDGPRRLGSPSTWGF
jgi:WD40 repeat protein